MVEVGVFTMSTTRMLLVLKPLSEQDKLVTGRTLEQEEGEMKRNNGQREREKERERIREKDENVASD